MSKDEYRLVDFGDGRKLELVAGRLIDRPSPAAEGKRRHLKSEWRRADSVFDKSTKSWRHHTPWPVDAKVNCGQFWMPVSPTPFGHLGLFPEQFDNWMWLANDVDQQRACDHIETRLSLNLFAYTGASTMALAKAGHGVAHVDAAKPNVMTARQAARLNGLEEHPIRYLVDDAAKFCCSRGQTRKPLSYGCVRSTGVRARSQRKDLATGARFVAVTRELLESVGFAILSPTRHGTFASGDGA